jgi:hypothetical protein
LIFSVLFLTLGFAAAKVPLKNGVQYTVVTDLPETMFLDQAYTMRVDSKNADAVPYEVRAAITITGPEGFSDKDIHIVWVTYDKDWNELTRFILGRGGTQHFSGEGSITWTGTGTIMMPGDYRIHMLNVTVLGSAPVGEYKAVVTVVGEEKPIEPIEARLEVMPKVLNLKSRGVPVLAIIRLPETYDPHSVDIKSVKLWFKNSYVQAQSGVPTKHYLLVMFPREEVAQMLSSQRGYVKLDVTGLANVIEFYGTDTIIVIKG